MWRDAFGTSGRMDVCPYVSMYACVCESILWMDGWLLYIVGASLLSKLNGGGVGYKLPWVAYKPSYVVALIVSYLG